VLHAGLEGRLLAFIHRRDQRYVSVYAALAELRYCSQQTYTPRRYALPVPDGIRSFIDK
jgi:hypothetical protein